MGVSPLRGGDPVVQDGHHLVASLDGQSAAWTKIVLDIDDDERVAGLQFVGTGSHGIPLRFSLYSTEPLVPRERAAVWRTTSSW